MTLSIEQQEKLTRVEYGTPMGTLLRYYWMPVLASSELESGSIKKIRIMCENLVLFRDMKGKAGILSEFCPHRGTSLAYGCVDEAGVRCAYHGWKFDASGKCLDLPAEPADSKMYKTVRAKAYHVAELGGLIFVYMGKEPVPQMPRYDLFMWEGVLRDIGYAVIPCNWLQIMENSVDPYHVEWLHGQQLKHTRSRLNMSVPTHYLRHQTRIGFDRFEYGIIKRRLFEDGSESDDDWETGHPLVFPNMVRVGSSWQHRFQIRVPVDNTHTLHFWYSCYLPQEGNQLPAQDRIPAYEVPWQDENGDFLVDYVDGQDIMCWVTQGKIADRTNEHLGSSDKGIILFRKILFEELEKVSEGKDPMCVFREADTNTVINLPQEKEKFGNGQAFLSESIAMSHVRYSPIRRLIESMCQDTSVSDSKS